MKTDPDIYEFSPDLSVNSANKNSAFERPSAMQDSPGNGPRPPAVSSGPWKALLMQAHLVGLPLTRSLWNRAAEAMPRCHPPLEVTLLPHLAIRATVCHPLSLRYSRSSSQSLSTLKWLREVLAVKGWDVSCLEDHISCLEHHISCVEYHVSCFSSDAELCHCCEPNVTDEWKEPGLVYKSYIVDASTCEDYDSDLQEANFCYRCCGCCCCGSDASTSRCKQSPRTTKFILDANDNETKTKHTDDPNYLQMTREERKNGPCHESRTHCVGRSQNRCKRPVAALQSCGLPPSPAGGHMTLLEAAEGITWGTTGLTCWGGAAVLAEWLDNNSEVLRGRRVLELGAGVGYTAAAVLRSAAAAAAPPVASSPGVSPTSNSCYPSTSSKLLSATTFDATSTSTPGPASYTATDCHPHVLELLHHNLALLDTKKCWTTAALDRHRRQLSERFQREELPAGDADPLPWKPPIGKELLSPGGVMTQVLQLDWRTPNYSTIPFADVLIAADIVYARHLLLPLARLIRNLLARKSENFPKDGDSKCLSNGTVSNQKKNNHDVNSNGNVRSQNSNVSKSSSRSNDNDVGRPVGYVACTRRNSETILEFLEALESQDLQYSLIYQATLDTESALFVYNESHVPVRVYKITLKKKDSNRCTVLS